MRNLLILALIVMAACYYFGISPTDFFPSVPDNPAARERHGVRSAEQATAERAQPTVAATPVANAADGSLANRWGSDSSPKKP